MLIIGQLARMPSAKKKRNNKKRVKERQKKSTTATTIQSLQCDNCRHGRPLLPIQDQPVVNQFLDKMWNMEMLSKPGFGTAIIEELLQIPLYQGILGSDDRRANLKACFISMGVNYILEAAKNATITDGTPIAPFIMEYAIAIAELLLEIEIIEKWAAQDSRGCIERDLFRRQLRKVRDLHGGSDQTVVRFFAKRSPCNCLDEHLRKVECLPKMGFCSGCHKSFEFMDLRKCTRCNLAHYCSRSCQVSDWPVHEKDCPLLQKSAGQRPAQEDIDSEQML